MKSFQWQQEQTHTWFQLHTCSHRSSKLDRLPIWTLHSLMDQTICFFLVHAGLFWCLTFISIPQSHSFTPTICFSWFVSQSTAQNTKKWNQLFCEPDPAQPNQTKKSVSSTNGGKAAVHHCATLCAQCPMIASFTMFIVWMRKKDMHQELCAKLKRQNLTNDVVKTLSHHDHGKSKEVKHSKMGCETCNRGKGCMSARDVGPPLNTTWGDWRQRSTTSVLLWSSVEWGESFLIQCHFARTSCVGEFGEVDAWRPPVCFSFGTSKKKVDAISRR